MTDIPSAYVGWWRITETSQWVNKYLDDLGPALISITGRGDRLRMLALLAYVSWTAECAALGDIEVAVLKRWSPPMNLRDNRSTWGALVSAAHKMMASDARTWAREHGHRL